MAKYILEYEVKEDERKRRFARKEDMRVLDLFSHEAIDLTALPEEEQKAISEYIDDFIDPEWSNFRIIEIGTHQLLLDTEPDDMVKKKYRGPNDF